MHVLRPLYWIRQVQRMRIGRHRTKTELSSPHVPGSHNVVDSFIFELAVIKGSVTHSLRAFLPSDTLLQITTRSSNISGHAIKVCNAPFFTLVHSMLFEYVMRTHSFRVLISTMHMKETMAEYYLHAWMNEEPDTITATWESERTVPSNGAVLSSYAELGDEHSTFLGLLGCW